MDCASSWFFWGVIVVVLVAYILGLYAGRDLTNRRR